MEILYESSDKSVSVVVENKRKLTGTEAGFIRPERYVSKKIEDDRFCCGNCVRYKKSAGTCFIVDVEDIKPLDCCNEFLSSQTYEEQPNKQMPLLPEQNNKAKIYIESGALSSEAKCGIVNETAYAKVDEEELASHVKPKKLKGHKSKKYDEYPEMDDTDDFGCNVM